MVQFVEVCAMRKGIFLHVTSTDRQRLEAIVRDPKSAQKHVWRAWVVLLTANGHGTAAIMAETGAFEALSPANKKSPRRYSMARWSPPMARNR